MTTLSLSQQTSFTNIVRNDSFVKAYTIDWLNAAGFINCTTQLSIENVQPNIEAKRQELGLPAITNPIHPVFRFERFDGLSPNDYTDLLDPVVRLASCMIGDVHILPFFYSFLNKPWVRKIDAEAESFFGQPVYVVGGDSDGQMTARDYKDTWQRMGEMSKYFTWKFEEPATPGRYAECRRIPNTSGAVKGTTYKSYIQIPRFYLMVLKRARTSAAMPLTTGLNPEDARLRTMVHMAMIMAHELCHALIYAFHQVPPDAYHAKKLANGTLGEYQKFPLPSEPFYRNDHIAELGWAHSQILFDGILEPIGGLPMPWSILFPYGGFTENIEAKRKPRTKERRFERWEPKVKKSPRKAIPMTYFQDLFTADFWDKTVLQNGLAALSVPDVDGFTLQLDVRTLDTDRPTGAQRAPQPSPSFAGWSATSGR